VSTVKCFENNPLVRAAAGEPGQGRVLVVDGGGSLRRCVEIIIIIIIIPLASSS
jgi:regulator of ribonuclease activity A